MVGHAPGLRRCGNASAQDSRGILSDVADPYAHLAQSFVDHYRSLRGVVRRELVGRQLEAHLGPPPQRVADVGGGSGVQAIRLARAGHEVTLLDPSMDMLERARAELRAQPAGVRARIELVEGSGEDGPRLLGTATYDTTLCHGVVMYLEDPDPLLRATVDITRPGGVVSILAKNAGALALRPALQGRYRDAIEVFDSDRDEGGLGVITRGDTIEDLGSRLEAAGADIVAWYGVRVLTDHLMNAPPGEDLDDVLKAEWEAGRRDPYRAVGRLIHVLARREGP